MKHSFLTTAYKEGYVHSCYNPETGRGEFRAQVANVTHECNTLAGAKRKVSALIQDKEERRGAFVGY